jgi:hypothetical protein
MAGSPLTKFPIFLNAILFFPHLILLPQIRLKNDLH